MLLGKYIGNIFVDKFRECAIIETKRQQIFITLLLTKNQKIDEKIYS